MLLLTSQLFKILITWTFPRCVCERMGGLPMPKNCEGGMAERSRKEATYQASPRERHSAHI